MNEILFAISLWRTPDDLTTSHSNSTRSKGSYKRVCSNSFNKHKTDSSAQESGQPSFSLPQVLSRFLKSFCDTADK